MENKAIFMPYSSMRKDRKAQKPMFVKTNAVSNAGEIIKRATYTAMCKNAPVILKVNEAYLFWKPILHYAKVREQECNNLQVLLQKQFITQLVQALPNDLEILEQESIHAKNLTSDKKDDSCAHCLDYHEHVEAYGDLLDVSEGGFLPIHCDGGVLKTKEAQFDQIFKKAVYSGLNLYFPVLGSEETWVLGSSKAAECDLEVIDEFCDLKVQKEISIYHRIAQMNETATTIIKDGNYIPTKVSELADYHTFFKVPYRKEDNIDKALDDEIENF